MGAVTAIGGRPAGGAVGRRRVERGVGRVQLGDPVVVDGAPQRLVHVASLPLPVAPHRFAARRASAHPACRTRAGAYAACGTRLDAARSSTADPRAERPPRLADAPHVGRGGGTGQAVQPPDDRGQARLLLHRHVAHAARPEHDERRGERPDPRDLPQPRHRLLGIGCAGSPRPRAAPRARRPGHAVQPLDLDRRHARRTRRRRAAARGVGNAAIATPATSTGSPWARASRSRTAAACRVFQRSDSTHHAAAS